MHVQFEVSEDDLIDATRRFWGRSRVMQSWRWKNLAVSSILAGLIAFTVFFIVELPLEGIICGIIAAALSAFLYPFSHRNSVDRRLRRLIREKFGTGVPFICEVELIPVGVWVRQVNTQTTYEWESVEAIKETEDSVDIFTREGGGVIVRKRAFQSVEDQKEFIELAEGYLELSRFGSHQSTAQLIKDQS